MKTHLVSGRTPEFAGSQRGLVVIELAITLPLIVLIMFATAELGRAFFQYTTLTKAVEAGTRYFASDSTNPTAAATTINLITTASPDGTEPAVLLKPDGSNGVDVSEVVVDGDHIRVTATYDFWPMLGGKLPIVGKIATFPMSVSHEMRAL